MQIIFVHHANREKIHKFPDNQEDDITSIGKEDAKITSKFLEQASAKLNIMAIYTSPFKRCMNTAKILNKRLHLPIFNDDRLNEFKALNKVNETWTMLQQRVMDSIKDVVFKYDNDPKNAVIMITSGINIAGFINIVYKIEASKDAPFIGVPSCSPLAFNIDKNYFRKEEQNNMNNLYIKKPSMEDKDQVMEFKNEFENINSNFAGHSDLNKYNNYEDWLKYLSDLEDETKLPKGYVTSTQYLVYRKEDNRLVGMFNIRHKLNDYLLKFGGHIGDCVRPTERKKGYATQIIGLAIQECKNMGINEVLITCKKSNIASAKSIIKNGGILENEIPIEGQNEFEQRYWIK